MGTQADGARDGQRAVWPRAIGRGGARLIDHRRSKRHGREEGLRRRTRALSHSPSPACVCARACPFARGVVGHAESAARCARAAPGAARRGRRRRRGRGRCGTATSCPRASLRS
eukprot:3089566-Pleurochrysis_carterae.AAC.1